MVTKECSAENRTTCRYHGTAAKFAPVTSPAVAQQRLSDANARMMTASGAAAFQAAEKARVEAQKDYLAVPKLQKKNKAESDALLQGGAFRESIRKYDDYLDGAIQGTKLDARYQKEVFVAKALSEELTSKDLEKLSGKSKSVEVTGNELWVHGQNKGLIGIEGGLAVGYNDRGESYKLSDDEVRSRASEVADFKAKDDYAKLMKGYAKRVAEVADVTGHTVKSDKSKKVPGVTNHVVRNKNNEIVAAYRTHNGILQEGIVGTSGGRRAHVDGTELMNRFADSSTHPDPSFIIHETQNNH